MRWGWSNVYTLVRNATRVRKKDVDATRPAAGEHLQHLSWRAGQATYFGAEHDVSALGGRCQEASHRPLPPGELARRGLCDTLQGTEPSGVR